MDLKEAALVGGDQASHWYYRAKFELLLKMGTPRTNARILDVGAGTGVFSRQLLERTDCAEAICVDTGYAENRTEYVRAKKLRFQTRVDTVTADLVLLMDVLEHVEDDVGLLSGYVRDAPAGTKFFITVPAFKWLWSEHDEFLGHHRRYTLRQIESVATQAGLSVVRGGYFLGLLLPLVAVQRVVGRLVRRADAEPQSQLRVYNAPLNALLFALGRLDVAWFSRNRIGGVTTYVAAVKR